MYQHVLIATDGSQTSDKAVDHGLRLAKALGAKVTALTTTEQWSAYAIAAEIEAGASGAIGDYEDAAAAAARKILDTVKASAAGVGVDCEGVHVADRQPAESIVQTASKLGCDLIVMGTHGRRGVDRLLLGSQAVETMTYATIPVLVVR